jgi:cell division protease FtsH
MAPSEDARRGVAGPKPAGALRLGPLRIRRPQLWLIPVGLLVLNIVAAQIAAPDQPAPVVIPYSAFKEQLQAGSVAEITTRGDAIQGVFRGAAATRFETRAPTFPDQGLVPLLESSGVSVTARAILEERPFWQSALVSIAPALLLSAVLLWTLSRLAPGRGGAFGLGRSRARRYDAAGPVVTFDQVVGVDEVKQELVEVVDFLRHPARYRRLGARIPKGVLLVGPPGTGKTLLARAVAGEAGVPFFSLSASEFVEMIVGVGASRVRDLFAQAKKEAPAIVFIDELDAVGRARGAGPQAGPGEREQTLNQLLVEMDGFEVGLGVVVLAATNRPEVLDQALLRPGRFDRHVVVPRPDRRGRLEILRLHSRGVPLAAEVSLADVAAGSAGLVGADLSNLVNEAALAAARRGTDLVEAEDFQAALEKVMLGAPRSVTLAPEERSRVAYHEAGHALLGLLVPEADPVHKVTIVARGQALGGTYQLPNDDHHHFSDEYLNARIVVALGGRAAEQIVFGSVSTGAQHDLRQATRLARRMVTAWGMSDEIGLVSLDGLQEDGAEGAPPHGQRPYSEATARAVDRAVRRIIDAAYREARTTLTRERDRLDGLAVALLERGSLDEREILDVALPSGNGDVTIA